MIVYIFIYVFLFHLVSVTTHFISYFIVLLLLFYCHLIWLCTFRFLFSLHTFFLTLFFFIFWFCLWLLCVSKKQKKKTRENEKANLCFSIIYIFLIQHSCKSFVYYCFSFLFYRIIVYVFLVVFYIFVIFSFDIFVINTTTIVYLLVYRNFVFAHPL